MTLAEDTDPCVICKEQVRYCDCLRCEMCGTLYSAEQAQTKLNNDNLCRACR